MRTVLLAVSIALLAGACTLFFEHGKADPEPPDASVTDDAQHPNFPDAADPIADADFGADAGTVDADHTDGGCDPNTDAGVPVDADFPVDAGW